MPITELWGRIARSMSREREEPVASERGEGKAKAFRKNRLPTQRREAERRIVAKACEECNQEKPAMAYGIPRTENRHRWMRENPKAGGGSIAKELGKMVRNLGRRDAAEGAAEKRPKQLFKKNHRPMRNRKTVSIWLTPAGAEG